jgi:hypothetical protein
MYKYKQPQGREKRNIVYAYGGAGTYAIHSLQGTALGKPKKDIENLHGFEYMYLSNLKVPYFLYSSSIMI